MNNTTLHISLPEPLVESAKERAENERFGTLSDYVRSLIRDDLRQMEEKKLEHMLLEGIRSGRGIEFGSKEWKEFRKSLVKKIKTQ
jgi:antitoxin ParD1/3/4